MRFSLLATALAFLATGAVAAQSGIEIQKSVYLERAERQDGRVIRALEPATTLNKGDTVVLMLHWSAPGRDDRFTVASPVPRDLAFKRSGGQPAEVSIDGGQSWGKLIDLRIGSRRASPQDVTHLRWQLSRGDAQRGNGVLSYSAVVK
jgi:hypothetical protein